MKKNRYLFTALAVFLLLSVGFCLFSFVFAAARNLSRQNQLSRFADRQKRENEWLNLEKQYGEWKNAENEFREFKGRFFIKAVNFPQFRADLNSFLTANQLKPSGFNFQTDKKSGEFSRIQVAINVDGSYPAIKKFIADVEHHPKMMFFSQLQMSGSKTAASSVGAKFMLEVYLVE